MDKLKEVTVRTKDTIEFQNDICEVSSGVDTGIINKGGKNIKKNGPRVISDMTI
jgi:hypothetical protein